MPSYDWKAATAGNTAISSASASGDHVACDAEIGRLRARAEAAEAKLATLAAHNRGHLKLPGSCCPHLALENLAIIGSEEETRDG